jgi:hypothetical protein
MPEIRPINLWDVYELTCASNPGFLDHVAVQLDSQWRPLGSVPRDSLCCHAECLGRYPAATAEVAIAEARASQDAITAMVRHAIGIEKED